jgi:hypothetical protein
MKPQRVQLSRRKGWRMPPNTVKVDRTTKWGNPCKHELPEVAVAEFREILRTSPTLRAQIRSELRGKNLACWCPLDGPCHADILLMVANKGAR